ncbi:hypothetical protein FEM08_23910 [Flavobacterium gilvum]|nr:hypothetical protein FEM08_36590 [Flavobacterium gilvum]KFC58793.1 hypothetical protein FEM08_23910 [Flavobacterium gilvum]
MYQHSKSINDEVFKMLETSDKWNILNQKWNNIRPLKSPSKVFLKSISQSNISFLNY